MSSARTDGPTTSRQRATREDRRDATAPRLSYEAFVEVGAGATGGFEAESVDLSLDGMRLRTAYLPELGEKLVCRFDGFGGEICAEAEVIWCHDAGRGGEFGMRFTNLDERGVALLEDMCRVGEQEAAEPEPSDPSAALPGSRVRLHIQGLGSPMRARVRDAARGEVLIGSNLEFLRVGRSVELEDVERADTRVALIEHVGVELDPETNIPQLVVALSYEGSPRRGAAAPAPAGEAIEDEDLTTAPFRTRGMEPETTPEPTVIGDDPEPTPSAGWQSARPARVAQVPAPSPAAAKAAPRPRPELDERAGDIDEEAAEAEEPEAEAAEQEPAEDDVALPSKVQQRLGALARKLAPALQAAGAGAKGAFGRIVQQVRERRARAEEQKAKGRAPKRTTAPPPGGVLKGDGRRVLRQQHKESVPPEAVAAPPKADKKRAVLGALLGMMVVLGIYYASASIREGGSDEADPALAAAATQAAPAAPAAAPGAPIATANVPLFGATPLSTTEPVPVPPEPGEAADEPAGDGAEDGKDEPAEAAPANLDKEWGVGEVTDPTVLRLKMDGNVEGIRGTETATGFTIVVPGRKSISSAAGFKAKDKRLDTVNVVNYPDRAEITLLFKKDVPAFVARATGKRIVIEIASAKKKGAKDEAQSDGADKKSKKKKK